MALDGLNVVGVGSFERNIWTGEAVNPAMGFFIDERADERQREALRAIWSGEAGGWPAGFAQLITEVRRSLASAGCGRPDCHAGS